MLYSTPALSIIPCTPELSKVYSNTIGHSDRELVNQNDFCGCTHHFLTEPQVLYWEITTIGTN
jgi:hypothetical protein